MSTDSTRSHRGWQRTCGGTAAAALLAGGSLAAAAPAGARGDPGIERYAPMSRVAASSPTRAALRAMTELEQAEVLGRCVEVSSLTYCLGQGFVSDPPDYAALLASADSSAEPGDLSFAAWVQGRASLSDAVRVAAETEEIAEAMDGVPSVLETQRLAAEADAMGQEGAESDPAPVFKKANAIMKGKQTRQVRSNWCGPATMQSLHWGSPGHPARVRQATWASRLGTTSGGTSMGSLVHAVNHYTRWPAHSRSGKYAVQSVNPLDANQFYWVHRAHMGTAKAAPIIEHPQLLARYFIYLKHDHGAHFQVGRGYKTVHGHQYLLIFEVFNERDYRADGNVTWGPRIVRAKSLLDATKANSFHNIGV